MLSKRPDGLIVRFVKPMGLGEATVRRRAADPAVPRDRFLWGPLMVNWLHQSLTYLDRGELAFRLVAESIALAVIFTLLVMFLPGLLLPLVLSAALVHTEIPHRRRVSADYRG